jgi:hypothetical protein
MTEADEFRAMYPMVFNYTIPIKEAAKTRDDKMGAGVMIEVAGKLLVATAAHCIVDDPAVLEDNFELPAATRVKILRRGADAGLDIGYMELEWNKDVPILNKGHATLDMLSLYAPKPADVVHIVGFPAVARKLDADCLTVQKKGFGTQLVTIDTDHYPFSFLRFSYPKEGVTWDYQKNEWTRAPFDEHPKGYSGGGVWSFTRPKERDLFVPQRHIRLYGIQCAWNEDERYVKCVPIVYWLKGVSDLCEDFRHPITSRFPLIAKANVEAEPTR